MEEEIAGETGGSILSNDGKTEIVIPAGAIEGTVTFLFVPKPEPGYSIGDLESASIDFNLTAKLGETLVANFDQPLMLTFRYTDE